MTPAQTVLPSKTESAPLLARVAVFLDCRPGVLLPVWIFAYFAVLWRPAQRPLWFDELLTFYSSTAPTIGSFVHSRFIDPTPPLSHVFFRASVALFGDSPFASRLPSMVAVLAAGLMVFALVRKRLGGALGLAALGIFWSSSLTVFAVEMRPYGLLLALFTAAAVCWLHAIERSRWTLWHAGLAAAIGAMFLTHCFSPPFAAAIGVGEIVRTFVARRFDKKIWAALLAPLVILPVYLPLVKNARALLCPPQFAATLITVPKFYLAVAAPLLPAMGAMVVLWLAAHGWGPRLHWRQVARPHEIGFAAATVCAPLAALSYSHWSGSPFWPRYGVGAILGGTLLLVALLAFATRKNPNLAVPAAAVILALFCITKGGTGHLAAMYENASTAYRTARPELPFVTASGLTFLEMDHREARGFVSRLYYLTDRDSAVRYHSNIFEGMPILKEWFPVRANVERYRDFTRRNRQFLVLATQGFAEDWLLPKLAADGAQIRLLREENTGYRDRELYEVTLRPEVPARYHQE